MARESQLPQVMMKKVDPHLRMDSQVNKSSGSAWFSQVLLFNKCVFTNFLKIATESSSILDFLSTVLFHSSGCLLSTFSNNSEVLFRHGAWGARGGKCSQRPAPDVVSVNSELIIFLERQWKVKQFEHIKYKVKRSTVSCVSKKSYGVRDHCQVDQSPCGKLPEI